MNLSPAKLLDTIAPANVFPKARLRALRWFRSSPNGNDITAGSVQSAATPAASPVLTAAEQSRANAERAARVGRYD